MATIGLDKLFYADITEDDNGNETYGKPKQLAKAISADLSIELNEATQSSIKTVCLFRVRKILRNM